MRLSLESQVEDPKASICIRGLSLDCSSSILTKRGEDRPNNLHFQVRYPVALDAESTPYC
jgi:hypothetical protein